MEATREWTDDLLVALIDECGEEAGTRLFRRYGHALPAAYRADWHPRAAVADLVRIEAVRDGGGMALSLYRPLEAHGGALRGKLFRAGAPISLSHVVPMFESMGLQVADERPYEVRPRDGAPTWVYDFGLSDPAGEEVDKRRPRVVGRARRGAHRRRRAGRRGAARRGPRLRARRRRGRTAVGREVAALHFALGARLQLHRLRDRIAALPRDDR